MNNNIFFVEIQEGHRQMKLFQFSDVIVTFKFMLDHISIQVLEYISSSLTIPIHCGAQRPSITAFTTHDKFSSYFQTILPLFPLVKMKKVKILSFGSSQYIF